MLQEIKGIIQIHYFKSVSQYLKGNEIYTQQDINDIMIILENDVL